MCGRGGWSIPGEGQEREQKPGVQSLVLVAARPVREFVETNEVARDVGIIAVDCKGHMLV